MFPLAVCKGDCDDDSECSPGLRCFQRTDTTSIPECSGEGRSGTDYCFDRPPNYLVNIDNDLGAGQYGLCEGDCDTDSDCISNLRCFQRSDKTSVPGCDGTGISGNDYCYNP